MSLSASESEPRRHRLDSTKAFALWVADPAATVGMPRTLLELAAQTAAQRELPAASAEELAAARERDQLWCFGLDPPSPVLFQATCQLRATLVGSL